MSVYLIRKALLSLLLLVTVSFGSFWVLAAHLNPLYPLLFAQPRPTEKINALIVQAHLHESIPTRYWLWIKGVVTGRDAGHTILDHVPIWHPVWSAFVHTIELAAGALLVALVFGIAVGVMAAWRWGRPVDRLLRVGSYLTWSTPVFVTALLLQAIVGRLQSSSGLHPFALTGVPTGTGLTYLVGWFQHMTLPIIAVALGYIGLYSRYVRSAMLVTLAAPYTTVARAKGLTERRVLIRHALRNALVPLVAVVTIDLGALVGTTLAVDIIFGLQGLGSLFLASITLADPFQLEAIIVVTVLAVVGFSLLGDVIYGWLDPRIRMT
jgi:peptide/nickel transport system permease protein